MADKLTWAVLATAGAGLAGALLARPARDPEPAAVQIEPTGRQAAEPGSQQRPALDQATAPFGEHSISGRVVDDMGRPLPAISVTARSESGPGSAHEATSSDDGRFEIRGLVKGRYRLELRSPTTMTSHVRYIAAPGPELNVVATPAHTITGRVTAPATVRVAALDGSVVAESESSAGQFRAQVPAGQYRLIAVGDGLESRPRTVRSASATGIVLALEPTLPVQGRVIDGSGRPLTAATVTVDVAFADRRRVTTDSNGNFEAHLLPGTVTVSAAAPGFIGDERLTMSAGRGFEPVLQLVRAGEVTGRVVDTRGAPVTGARVEIEGDGVKTATPTANTRFEPVGELGILRGPIPMPPPPGMRLVVATHDEAQPEGGNRISAADGRYRLSELAAGNYTVIARHPDFADAHAGPVVVTPGQTETLDIVVADGVSIQGVVVHRGSEVAFADLRMTTSDGSELMVYADERGHFQSPRVTGKVTVETRAAGFVPARQKIDTVANEALSLVIELARADAAISGRVVDANDFAVGGARIQASSGGLNRMAVADEHGRFEVLGLPEGTAELLADAPGFVATSAKAVAGASGIRIRLELGGNLAIEVRDATGRAINGAELSALGPSGPLALAEKDGVYYGFSAQPGRYQVTATKAGYVPATTRVEVPRARRSGETSRRVALTLRPGAQVAGDVRDENGVRVRGARVSVGSAETLSDEFGHFRLADVPTGDIEILAEKAGRHGRTTLSLAPGDIITSARINVRPESGTPPPPDHSESEGDIEPMPE